MNNIKYTTKYLPNKHIWLKRFLILLLIVIVLLMIFYPYEFGSIIGKWVDAFKNGFHNKNILEIWHE